MSGTTSNQSDPSADQGPASRLYRAVQEAIRAIDRVLTAIFLPQRDIRADFLLWLATLAGRALLIGIVFVFAGWLLGFSSAPVTSTLLGPSEAPPEEAVVYALPATEFVAEVTFRILGCKVVQEGDAKVVQLTTDLAFLVSQHSVPSAAARYSIATDSLKNLIESADFNVGISPTGLLTAVGTTSNGVAADIKGLSDTIAQLISVPSLAPTGSGQPVRSQEEICSGLPIGSGGDGAADASQSVPLQPQTNPGALEGTVHRGAGPLVLRTAGVLEPPRAPGDTKPNKTGIIAMRWKFDPKDFLENVSDEVKKAVEGAGVEFAVELPPGRRASSSAPPSAADGVVYRSPVAGRLYACRNTCFVDTFDVVPHRVVALEDVMIFASGEEAVIKIDRNWFSTHATTLTFDSSGALVTVSTSQKVGPQN